MQEDYKVRYKLLGASYVDATEWTTRRNAISVFNNMKKDLNNRVVWAELIYSPVDGDPNGDEQVVDDFERKPLDIGVSTILIPKTT